MIQLNFRYQLFNCSVKCRHWRGDTMTEGCSSRQVPEFTLPGSHGENLDLNEKSRKASTSEIMVEKMKEKSIERWEVFNVRFYNAGDVFSVCFSDRRVGSLQLLSRLAVRASLARETNVQQLPLPPRLRALVAALFASTIR